MNDRMLVVEMPTTSSAPNTEIERSDGKLVIKTRLPAIGPESGASGDADRHEAVKTVNFSKESDGLKADDSREGRSASSAVWVVTPADSEHVDNSDSQPYLPSIKPSYGEPSYSRAMSSDPKPKERNILSGSTKNDIICSGATFNMSKLDARKRSSNQRSKSLVISGQQEQLDGYNARFSSAHARKSIQESRISRQKSIQPMAPLKQKCFVLQKPGIRVQHRKENVTLKSTGSYSKDSNSVRGNIWNMATPELAFFAITFRDSDSPTYDTQSEPHFENSMDQNQTSSIVDARQRMRSASIQKTTEIAGGLTGTTKVIHSRSNDKKW